jgi:hypothetical protein
MLLTPDTDPAQAYLSLIEDWVDPNPAPIVEKHDRFLVVRDDLLGYGSKIRGLDYLIGHHPNYAHIKEWVFGACPATGYAQISLPYVCAKYGKTAHLFMAKRKEGNLHPYQQKGIDLGAIYHWVDMGMLTVTKKRATDYAAERPDIREVLPIGLEHATVIACFIKVARSLELNPIEFWSAGSSGTLNRALQLAWPSAIAHVVSVGHNMSEREIGRAVYHKSPYKFDQAVKPYDTPPFPSAPTYDAKVWPFIRDEGLVNAIYWNVGA